MFWNLASPLFRSPFSDSNPRMPQFRKTCSDGGICKGCGLHGYASSAT